MIYDPNYKNQVFWDTNDFSIGEIVSKLKTEIATQKYKTKRPVSRFSKFFLIGFGVYMVLVFSSLLGSFIITRSLLFMMVAGLCFLFFWGGWLCLYIAVLYSVLSKRCTLPIEATCIGYSLSNDGNHSNGGGLSLCPVFEYEYGGAKITAFDGIYDNVNKKPSIGAKGTIFINPEEPDEIVWTKKNKIVPFMILAFLFAVVLSMAIFWIVINDENFMNEALNKAELAASSLAGFANFYFF